MYPWGDWYWTVTGKTGVYSSKRNTYVPTSDTDYVAWQAAHPQQPAVVVPAEEDVWFYVKDFLPWWVWDDTTKTMSQPTETTYTKPQLRRYDIDKRTREVNGGMIAAGVPVQTDDRSRQFIADARRMAEADPNYTTKWFGSDGNFYDVDAAQVIEMSNVVNGHTNSCYLVFDQVSSDIQLGSVTTIAQIDAAYAGL